MGYIYLINNTITNAAYIGSTHLTVKDRYARHTKDLRAGIHHSKFLQRAWNKYGPDVFETKELEQVPDEALLIREQFYLDGRKNNYPSNKNYNMCWTAGNCKGRVLSQATRDKISKSQIGKKKRKESIDKAVRTWMTNHGKVYRLIDPQGNIHEVINLREFGREHGLTAINQLTRGKIRSNGGWTLENSPKGGRKKFGFVSPDGVVYDEIMHLKNFCKEHELGYKGMNKLHNMDVKSYYGWSKL
jgi:group I intron endonuclease